MRGPPGVEHDPSKVPCELTVYPRSPPQDLVSLGRILNATPVAHACLGEVEREREEDYSVRDDRRLVLHPLQLAPSPRGQRAPLVREGGVERPVEEDNGSAMQRLHDPAPLVSPVPRERHRRRPWVTTGGSASPLAGGASGRFLKFQDPHPLSAPLPGESMLERGLAGSVDPLDRHERRPLRCGHSEPSARRWGVNPYNLRTDSTKGIRSLSTRSG